jgi:hypothetical protein
MPCGESFDQCYNGYAKIQRFDIREESLQLISLVSWIPPPAPHAMRRKLIEQAVAGVFQKTNSGSETGIKIIRVCQMGETLVPDPLCGRSVGPVGWQGLLLALRSRALPLAAVLLG